MATVIAGFCIVGVCFGAQPLVYAVVSEILPEKHRPIAQATVNFSSGLGVVIGICLSGGLLRSGHLENFRIYCSVVAGTFALATLGTGLYYNPPPRELQLTLTLSEKLNRLDWIGYLLFVPGLVLFCVGLSYHKNPNACIAAACFCVVAIIASFFLVEPHSQFTGHIDAPAEIEVLEEQTKKEKDHELTSLPIDESKSQAA
ncbi:hypothetical protein LTR67_011313 [Exophiala xenobiotica]